MKRKKYILLVVVTLVFLVSCKLIGRTAAKYWTRKQIKEFVSSCETNASKLLGEDKAKQYCDCAVDVVASEYKDYDDAKKVSIRDVLRIAKDCK